MAYQQNETAANMHAINTEPSSAIDSACSPNASIEDNTLSGEQPTLLNNIVPPLPLFSLPTAPLDNTLSTNTESLNISSKPKKHKRVNTTTEDGRTPREIREIPTDNAHRNARRSNRTSPIEFDLQIKIEGLEDTYFARFIPSDASARRCSYSCDEDKSAAVELLNLAPSIIRNSRTSPFPFLDTENGGSYYCYHENNPMDGPVLLVRCIDVTLHIDEKTTITKQMWFKAISTRTIPNFPGNPVGIGDNTPDPIPPASLEVYSKDLYFFRSNRTSPSVSVEAVTTDNSNCCFMLLNYCFRIFGLYTDPVRVAPETYERPLRSTPPLRSKTLTSLPYAAGAGIGLGISATADLYAVNSGAYSSRYSSRDSSDRQIDDRQDRLEAVKALEAAYLDGAREVAGFDGFFKNSSKPKVTRAALRQITHAPKLG